MVTMELKARILDAIKENRVNYPSDNKHAAALGIAASIYNVLKKGKVDKQMSDSMWIVVARRLGISLGADKEWKTAETPTFVYITEQLSLSQSSGLSGILCDIPNIGKTFTAKAYVRTHKNAIYVDCGQVKTPTRMIRYIAKEFGINNNGRLCDIYDDLIFYLKTIEKPLIILDEAGDMNYATFLEMKALWNATERCCAWYMMGADGLRAKMERNIANEKLGYTEMFSRYGDNYNRVTPQGADDRNGFLRAQAAIVAKVNAPEGTDINRIVNLSKGGLRRVYTEIEKLR